MTVFDEYFSDWEFIVSLLPEGWREKFREYKVLKFGRKFRGPEKESDLLRVIFMHLVCGFSLRTTVAEAKAAGIVDIVDVTLFKHFRKCERFFGWCIEELLRENHQYRHAIFQDGRQWKAIDGSLIREPGVTGSYRRIHYSFNLPQLNADQIIISDIKTGEKLGLFEVTAGDVLLVDRGFMNPSGIQHVLDGGGDILGRFSPLQKSLFEPDSETAFDPIPKLRSLRYGEIGGWDLEIKSGNGRIRGRLCARKNPPADARREENRIRQHARNNKKNISANALELCTYTLIFTTLPTKKYSDEFIIEAYRLRWQVELMFKRLKSLLEIGQLHKYDDLSIRTYLNGKLLIALLIEKMIRLAETFSP